MIDLKLLEKEFESVATKLAIKKVSPQLLNEVKELFEKQKPMKQALETLQAKRNSLSKEIGTLMREGKKEQAQSVKEEVEKIKEEMEAKEKSLEEINTLLEEKATAIPNIPDADVPEGEDEEDNVEIKKVFETPTFDFESKAHWELGEANGWLDFARGVKVAKSRFSVVAKEGAKLNRALRNYMIDFNAKRGFEEISVPYIVNEDSLFSTGQLPKFADDLFKVEGEELYMIPTTEVPLINLYRDEIIPAESLPIKHTAYSANFRKEAGSSGRDTRGMIRQHQFEKVELIAITKPQESDAMLQEMADCSSDLLESLGLAHRQVILCGGDLGFGATKTIDTEVWIPSQKCYREIASTSNTRDFQARRAMIRFKDGKKNRLAHTLNGTSVAIGRALIAIMENYQQADGTIEIPEVLKKYI